MCTCVCICACAWVSCVTRTSSCGKGPREFSGTLIGGMTQSLFMRFSWLSVFRNGNTISCKSSDMAGGAATCWTCEKEMIKFKSWVEITSLLKKRVHLFLATRLALLLCGWIRCFAGPKQTTTFGWTVMKGCTDIHDIYVV